MALLGDLVERFLQEERPISNLLDPVQVVALAVKACEAYSGYGALASHLAIPIAVPPPEPPTPYPEITVATAISVSEWSVIAPLFMLYVERENALQLEASRGMGLDPFGRSSSEVAGDIAAMELELPHRAFQRDILTV